MARFCPNLKNKDVKKDFDELVDTFGENKAYYLFDKNNGNTLNYAQNGAVSKLFNDLVDNYSGDRSQALKTKANALKQASTGVYDVLDKDENGEPAMSDILNTFDNKDINKDDFMRDVAFMRDEAQKALSEGISVAEFNGIHKTNFGNKDGRVTISTNPTLKGVHLNTDLRSDKLVYTETRNHIAHNELIGFLQKKFNLGYQVLNNDQYSKLTRDPLSNCCVVGNTVYVRDSRNITNEQLIEEFLHPAIHSIRTTSKFTFSSLLNEAKKDFPGLHKAIQEQYANVSQDKNIVSNVQDEELVAHVLSKYYNKEVIDNGFNSRKMVNLVNKFIQKVKNIFQDMFGAFSKKNGTTKLSAKDIADISDINFDTLSQMFNIEDTYFSDELGVSEIMNNKDYEPIYAGQPDVLITDAKNVFKQLVVELRHRTNQPLRAIETVEGLALNIQNQDDYSAANSILDFIEKQAEEAKNRISNTQNLNATQLVQLKTDFLGTYKGVLTKLHSYAVVTNDKQLKDRVNFSSSQMNVVENFYIDQLEKYASTFVDNYINQHVKEGDKESFRQTAKDWLLKQEMYNDISSIERWGGMFENSRNPILRIAFNMISNAHKRTQDATLARSIQLVKAYKKAFNSVERSVPGSRQQIFLERDEHGRFTGNLISKVNNGTYQNQKADFIKQLKQKYVSEEGAHLDEKGNIYFKDDDQSVWDADGNWVKPTRYKYEDEITKWQSGKGHRQFTTKYYLERHTKPYREYIKNGRKIVEEGHGLSPNTEAIERDLQQQISNIEEMCMQDGYFAPWKLNSTDRSKLLRLRAQKENLSNLFYEDGTPKYGDDLTVAQELLSWKSYIKGKIQYKTDKDLYLKDYKDLVEKYGEDSDEVKWFLKYNSKFGINSDFISALMDKFKMQYTPTTELNKARSILSQYKKMLMRSDDPSSIDFSDVEGNPDFWDRAKEAELNVDIQKSQQEVEHQETKEGEESFFDYVNFKEVPHYEDGKMLYYTENGVKTDKYVTELQWLRDYTLALYTSNDRFNDLRSNHGIEDNSVFLQQAKEDWIQHQLSMGIGQDAIINTVPESFILDNYYYNKYYYQNEGEQRPLSMFKYMEPKGNYAEIDGIRYATKDWNPSGKYSKIDMSKSSEFVDDKYDQNVGGEQADIKKYDNTANFNKAVNTKEKEEFYNLIMQTMKEANDMIPYIKQNKNKDVHKAPQVYASTMANLSRTRLSDIFRKVGYFWSRLTKVDDNSMYLNNNEVVTRPDGTIVYNIPIRFLKCEHPESISSDLVSSVSMFYNMANNFKYKSEIENDLLILQHTLDLRNNVQNNSNGSVKALENLIQGNIYGNTASLIRKQHPRDTKLNQWDRRLVKYINTARRYSSFRMLAWNTTSAFVGALSSATIILRDAYVGKYITPSDLVKASLYFTKDVMPLMFNMGDELAHNKLTAMMQKMQLSKQNNEIFKTSRSKLLRFVGEHWAMGGYTIGDYCNNSIQLLAYCNNLRLYNPEGDALIDRGFYTKGQLIDGLMRKGLTRKEAVVEYHNTKYSMYNAYGYKNNKVFVKPEFKQFVTEDVDNDLFNRLRSRTALANGLMNEQETSAINNNIFGKFLVSMRKFAIQFLYAAWAGGNDYIPIEVQKNVKGKYMHKDLTAQQKRNKGYYDFETGEITRGYVRQSIYGVVNHGIPAMWDKITKASKDGELTEKGMTKDEVYATKTLLFTLGAVVGATAIAATLKTMVDGMTPLDDDLPFAGMMEDLDQADVNAVLQNNYQQLIQMPLAVREEKAKQIYLRLLYLGYVREVNENLTTIDPRTYSDFITSVTTFLSTSNKFEAAAADVALGLANPDYYDKTVNNGPYKDWSVWKRDLVRLSPLDNMITNHTDRGLKSKTKFYYNLNQVIFELAGMNQPAPSNVVNQNDLDTNFGNTGFGNQDFGNQDFGDQSFN